MPAAAADDPADNTYHQSRYARPRAAIDSDRDLGWMRRVWPIVRSHRSVFSAAILAGFIATALSVAVPITVGRGIDAIDAGDSVAPFVIALAVFAVARFGLGYMFRFGLFRAAHNIESDLRNLVFERLTELSFTYWDRTQSGQVISRANTDVRSIQLLFAFGPMIAMQFVLLTWAVIAMVIIDLPLTLVAVTPLPFVYLVGVRLRSQLFPLSWVVQARQADVATIVDENIQGARVVKAFSQEQNQVQHLARSARSLRWAGTELADARARNAPLMEALPRLGLAFVLLYGGTRAVDGSIQIGELVTFSTFVLMLATPFRLVGFILVQWQRAAAAAVRIFEILDEVPEIVDPSDPTPLSAPDGRIVFDSVKFSYATGDGAHILNDLSFEIEAGETVAIVGRTGSGKSTIARLLARFYDVDEGRIEIDGLDVRELSLSDLRQEVTIAADDPFLFATTIRDNIAFARPDSSDATVASAIADAAADSFVADLPLGIQTQVGERGLTLSGGQRQRLALARTLLADPSVMVLDDATSAVDVGVEQRIHTALKIRRTRRTTILIAHRLSTIALADRVLLIDGGRVVAGGHHHELLRSEPLYAAILADADHESSASDHGEGAT